MPTDNDFLAAILASPADDGPRLVYADWLESEARRTQTERDRGEFIRVQCELASLPGCASCQGNPGWKATAIKAKEVKPGLYPCDDCERNRLKSRESELWPAALFHILDGIKPALPEGAIVYKDDERPSFTPTRPEAYVRRGFVADLTCPWSAWRDHAAAIRAAAPVERVRLSTTPLVSYLHDRTSSWATLCHGTARADDIDGVEDGTPWGKRIAVTGNEYSATAPPLWIMRLLVENWPGIDFALMAPAEAYAPFAPGVDAEAMSQPASEEQMEAIEEALQGMPSAALLTPRQQFRQFLAEQNQPPRRPGGRRPRR